MVETRWVEMLPWFPKYWISDSGRVIGQRHWELTLFVNEYGYLTFKPRYADGRKKTVRVNRAVCWYFNGPYPDDGEEYDAAHLDHIRTNNYWWNLEWQTAKRNINDPATLARMSEAAYQRWTVRRNRSKLEITGTKGV